MTAWKNSTAALVNETSYSWPPPCVHSDTGAPEQDWPCTQPRTPGLGGAAQPLTLAQAFDDSIALS